MRNFEQSISNGVWNSYKDYLESDVWKGKRALILAHFKNTCQKCGSTRFLGVHHLSYERIGQEKFQDVTVLCFKCHGDAHGKN